MANAIQNMTATPRNRLVGMLADGVQSVSDFAGKPFGYDNPPGQMLMNGLGVNDLATVLDRASYGERMTTGQGQTLQLRPEVVGAAGAVLPIAAKAPKVARALGGIAEAGMANLATPSDMAMQGQRGAVVYHGSPHTFDNFDMSKIGTGEGAQAYGHGLYFADSPEVARGYQASTQAIDKQSSFYKVDLPDEHIAKMLDWDKPLSQQAPNVQQALSKTPLPPETTGAQAYDWLQQIGGGTKDKAQAFASRHLIDQGIPGIRYLDQGSRTGGAGTSNYVVFDDALPKILERNGASR